MRYGGIIVTRSPSGGRWCEWEVNDQFSKFAVRRALRLARRLSGTGEMRAAIAEENETAKRLARMFGMQLERRKLGETGTVEVWIFPAR